MVLRRVFSAMLAMGGLVALLFATGNASAIDHTIENSRKLDAQFRMVARIVDESSRREGMLPTNDQLGQLLSSSNAAPYEILLVPQGFDQCDVDPAGFANLKDGYILAAWRGEWYECYAPAYRKSTLILDPKGYTLSGRVSSDTALYLLVFVCCFAGAFFLWSRKASSL